jgi:hypothetical protein
MSPPCQTPTGPNISASHRTGSPPSAPRQA